MKKTLILVLLSLALTITGCKDKNPRGDKDEVTTGNKIGNRAPEFQLLNLEGKAVSLSSFRGKPVFINFWSVNCPPCVAEMPLLQTLHDKWRGKGLVVLAIHVGGDVPQIANFIESRNLSLPVLLDDPPKVADSYHIQFFPTTYLIDTNGIIQDTVIGAFANLEQIEDRLKKIMS